jgi:hypothetical protein
MHLIDEIYPNQEAEAGHSSVKRMKHTITPSADGRYIVIKVRGEINRKTAMQQNLEAHALGRRLGINRYLVDVTEAKNTDSVRDSYDFAYTDMNITEGIDKAARVATLVSQGDHSHDFIEIVSRNSGLNVTLFTDRELAVQHLLKK